MFYVDQSWLDAFVDGALSLANHTTSFPVTQSKEKSKEASTNIYGNLARNLD